MKNSNKLINILYVISRLSFRLLQLVLLFVIISECTPNGKIGNFHFPTHHSKGYPLTANIQLNLPDTIIKYKSNLGNGMIQKYESTENNKNFDKIKKDTSIQKTYYINNFTFYNNTLYDIPKSTLNSAIGYQNSEIKIMLNPTSYFFKSVLILKNYLSLVLVTFISFQFMRLFKQLKTNFDFNNSLIERIKNIGYSLILYQIINFITSIIASKYLTGISYYHSSSIDTTQIKYITLNNTIDFNFTILFIGLCCLVLSRLLRYGNDLQNENELTI